MLLSFKVWSWDPNGTCMRITRRNVSDLIMIEWLYFTLLSLVYFRWCCLEYLQLNAGINKVSITHGSWSYIFDDWCERERERDESLVDVNAIICWLIPPESGSSRFEPRRIQPPAGCKIVDSSKKRERFWWSRVVLVGMLFSLKQSRIAFCSGGVRFL